MGYSGAGGKLIDEKNQKQKISWHCPFKVLQAKSNIYTIIDNKKNPEKSTKKAETCCPDYTVRVYHRQT